MVELVVNKRGTRLGYKIGGKFFSKSFIDSILSKELGYDKVVIGKCVGNSVVLDGKTYKPDKDYLSCLKSLTLDLGYNDISFIARIPSEDELYDVSSFWSNKDLSRKHLYTIVDNNLKTLGYLATSTSIDTPYDCYICMLEIIDKGRGTGTRVVKELTKRCSLLGYSCVTAKDFWIKCGAVFKDLYQFKVFRNI